MSKVGGLNPGQQMAVDTRNKHILVSAPAGSGKTKILVSRILKLLMEGVHVDRLIVLTFTKDAASEMKQRLITSLEAEIENTTDVEMKNHLLLQKQKIPFSYITNFHTFCKDLIEHYGFLVGVQMGFEVLENSESVRQECMDKILEEAFSTKQYDDFRKCYFPRLDDLKDNISKLYETLQASGDKEQFVSHFREDVYGFFEDYDSKDLSEWEFYPDLLEILKSKAVEALVLLEELKDFCEMNGVDVFSNRPEGQKGAGANQPVPYDAFHDYYTQVLERIDSFPPFKGEGGLHELCSQKPPKSYMIQWKKLGIDEEIKEEYTKKKDAVNNLLYDTYTSLVDIVPGSMEQTSRQSKKALETLLELVFMFEKNYSLKKKEYNVLDFNDLEKYATLLLSDKFNIAKDLNGKLYEIMVDEYQDTNHVQEHLVQLISKATSHEVPCFMVGDMKQSIYRFRQADPAIFKQKYDTFPQMDNACRIDLGFNYRSSKVVLDSINFIFNQIMDTSIGELEYYKDKSAQLNYDFLRKEGAKDDSEYDQVKQKALVRMASAKDDFTEVLMINSDSGNTQGLDENEYEAYLIASRILELVNNGLDGKELNFDDICVLMRATPAMMTYKKVFDKCGVPANIVLSGGFMESVEIRLMLMVFKAFSNPRDDLAMLSFLKAPFDFSNYSEESICLCLEDGKSIYDSLKNNDAFSEFFEAYDDLKDALYAMPFSNWVELFYETSGYLNRVYASRNGMSKYQNLKLLVDRIKENEKSISHISDWVAYFEGISGSGDAPATLPKDNKAVTFTTIHKSKGLEYPVVFVAMHSKNFNLQDEKARVIFNRRLSMALKPRRLEQASFAFNGMEVNFKDVVVEYPNSFLTMFKQFTNRETISEEMRIYYVALTRASKKLILTGSLSKEDLDRYMLTAQNAELMDLPENETGWIINRKDRKATCYLDWLMPSVLRHSDVLKDLSQYSDYKPRATKLLMHYGNDTLESRLENTSNSRFTFKWLSHDEILNRVVVKDQQQQVISSSALFDKSDYAYQNEIELPRSIAVTTLEKQEKQVYPAVYKKDEEAIKPPLDAASIGTLVHEFMEHLPLDKDIDLALYMKELYENGMYNSQEYEVLVSYQDKIDDFMNNHLFILMKTSQQCLAEQPFCMLYEDMVIHGTIDVLCINENSITIIDYKTDRVSSLASQKKLVERHQFQLNLYKEALQKIYPGKTVEAYLYYLEISKDIKV